MTTAVAATDPLGMPTLIYVRSLPAGIVVDAHVAVATYLYDAEGHDRQVELSTDLLNSRGQRSLLWIDADARELAELKGLARLLALDPLSLRRLARPDAMLLERYSGYIQFGVDTAPATVFDEDGHASGAKHRLGGTRLDFLVGSNWLLTVHDGRIDFIDSFRAQDRAETMIGALTTHDFAASLLDAHLEAFFDEIGRVETMVDRLDEQALTRPSSKSLLGRMVALRRRVSRLRTRLSGQRAIFHGLARPDLQTIAEAGASPHFEVLVGRFERVVDEVEHTRELIVGSFELFASRTAQQTNELVKVLTFLTAVIGVCAAVAGVFGMNFETGFFTLGDTGFYITLAALAAIIAGSTIVARWRRWI